ncbi:hypothetical protein U9607_004645 [Vibrio alginolyticus]|uniref:hypothetical protein n=1 Tax=Vibrio sp. JC34 TaxID=3042470 RepID=UPI002AFB7447|nr:hypothetical protein [Vibrio alginolyticus]
MVVKQLENLIQGKTESEVESINQIIFYEYNHAWETHRHHENLRARYVAFMFTVAFAGTALLGSQVKELQADNIYAIALCLCVSVVSLFSIRSLLNIVNSMRNVFPHYEDVWKQVRTYFLDEGLEQNLNIRNRESVINRTETFGKGIAKIGSLLQSIYASLSLYFLFLFLYKIYIELQLLYTTNT